eukprot:TRINITY_DN12023_c0_g1_i2.p1 TRINITY_DN12023_c0_g1~~TRINITY_DN12023_c0_g1_i2.p1  ORF type:complete len:162 (+),score=45.46 TRINITY_DN12023_c0_g1_i2:291-776(+)
MLVSVYTSDPAVKDMFISLTPIAAFHYLLSGVTFTFQGVLEGMYKIRTVMLGTILGSWGSGIMGMAILIYGMHYRVHGIWWSLCIGEAVHSSILFAVIMRTDWVAQAQEVVQRARLVEAQYDVIAEECEQSMKLLSRSMGEPTGYGTRETEPYNQLTDLRL